MKDKSPRSNLGNLQILSPKGRPSGAHNEVITFGAVPDNSDILPHFWDITTTLLESTYSAQLTLPYNREEIQALGYTEEDIVGAYYDPLLNTWTYFPATFDSTAQTATFNVSHFSRYALALQRSQATNSIHTTIQNTPEETQARVHNYGRRIIRSENAPEPRVLGASISVTSIDEMKNLVDSVAQLVEKYPTMNIEQKIILQTILIDINTVLQSLRQ